MIQFPKSNKNRFKLDMAPLIDVVFLLLIFFMLTFAVQGQGMDISLPEGTVAEINNDEKLIVSIGTDGVIKINDKKCEISALKLILKGKLNDKQDKLVVIEADNKTSYDLFARIMDIARQAGAKDFSIVM